MRRRRTVDRHDKSSVNPLALRSRERCSENDGRELNIPLDRERRVRSGTKLEDDRVDVHLIACNVAQRPGTGALRTVEDDALIRYEQSSAIDASER